MLSWFQIPISKPRRSLFSNQLAHPTGAYSGSLRMKRQGELHCKVTTLPPPPPRYHPTSLTIFRYPFILLSEERRYERFVFCSRTQFTVTRLGYEPEPLNLGSNAPSRRMPRHHWLFMSTEAVSLNAIAPWKAHYKRRTGRIWSSSVDKTRSPDCQKQSLRNSRTGFWRRRVYI